MNPKSTIQFLWSSPREGLLRDYELDRSRATPLRSLAELRSATQQEVHGVEIDYDIFENLSAPQSDKPHSIYYARDLNFRLKRGSKAVDAGLRLPNINDDFVGNNPDLGAYELGGPVPSYGPRTRSARSDEY